jgi:DNA repair protein RadC
MQQELLSYESVACDRFADLEAADLDTSEQSSVIRLALAVLETRHRPGEPLCSPGETRAYLRLLLGERKSEVFGCLFLDNRNRVRGVEELFQGTIDGASVHARVVVQRALEVNAAAVLLFHNHPSGVAEPSRADQAITRRLCDALALVDIRVLDHFIVTVEQSLSFSERGLL